MLDLADGSFQPAAMPIEPPPSDLQKLMASLGFVMLHWCFLEDELTETIMRLRVESDGGATLIRVRGSFSDRLCEWRGLLSQKTRRNPELAEAIAGLANEMEHLKGMRNQIAHNLGGASAAPEDGQPFIWCKEAGIASANDERSRITLDELREMTEAMDRCRSRLRAVGR